MSPWLIIGAGVVGAWAILRKEEGKPMLPPPPSFHGAISSVPAPAPKPATPTIASWVTHVDEASGLVKAWNENVTTTADMSQLRAELEAPIPVLDAQRDLNLLGATPPLAEDGNMGPKTTQAVKDYQSHGNLPVTGQLDAKTNYALRFDVGEHVNQDTST